MVGQPITVRFAPELYEVIREVSRNRGENQSTFIRRAVLTELSKLAYLTPDQDKALGLSEARKEPED